MVLGWPHGDRVPRGGDREGEHVVHPNQLSGAKDVAQVAFVVAVGHDHGRERVHVACMNALACPLGGSTLGAHFGGDVGPHLDLGGEALGVGGQLLRGPQADPSTH